MLDQRGGHVVGAPSAGKQVCVMIDAEGSKDVGRAAVRQGGLWDEVLLFDVVL